MRNMPETSVEQLMQRLHAEADRYRKDNSCSYSHAGVSSPAIETDGFGIAELPRSLRAENERPVLAVIDLGLREYEQVEPPDACPFIDGKCTLRKLLGYQDRAFIRAAYWAVLRRAPDDQGANTYLRLLRGGAPKIEILKFLRCSVEGR